MAAKKTEHPVNLGGLRNISWKAGAYQFKVSLGYGADGRRKQKYERVHPKDIEAATENGVRKELSQKYLDFEAKWKGRGEIVKAVKFQTLGDEWLKLPGRRSESTVARYAQISERVYEAIGHIYVDKLTARQIQQYFYDLQNLPTHLTKVTTISCDSSTHHR
jgi:hypothetical protein